MKRLRLLLAVVCLLATVDVIAATASVAVAGPQRLDSLDMSEPVVSLNDRQLNGISARGSTDVWAVGSKNTSGKDLAYTQHWDGTTWRQVATPGTSGGDLQAVSAVTTDDVWAGGYRDGSLDRFPYLLHFDGTTWQVVSQPASRVPGELTSMAAVGPDDVYAVGFHSRSGGVYKAVVEHWDGQNWKRLAVPSPLAGADYVALSSVTAISASDVWAVGVAAKGGNRVPYALHWDGAAWSTMDLPKPGDDTFYTSISGSSPNDVWAIGSSLSPRIITEHWNGSGWSDVAFPLHSSASLVDVTTLPNGDAWAVGEFLAGDHPVILSPLIGFWDGSSWTIQSAQGGAAHQSFLNSVGGSSPDDAWAVGYAGSKALIRHWDGTEWQ